MSEHRDDRLADLPIYYVSNEHPEPESIVVLLPGAQSSRRVDRLRRGYSRWTWHSEWPSSLVLVFADPVLQLSQELDGGWFIHPKHDVVAAIAGITAEIAGNARVSTDRIVFYGSSLGGFGALGSAAHLTGARAVAEVPQIDFTRWGKRAIAAVESHILKQSLTEFQMRHPERMRIPARFEFAGLIPPLKIISNTKDRTVADQQNFIDWCSTSDLPRLGEQKLELTERVMGHAPLKRADAVKHVVP